MNRSGEFTYQDYRSAMPPRAFGSETEYTDTSDLAESQTLYINSFGNYPKPPRMLDIMDKSYAATATSNGADHDVLTTTGGRLYLDCDVMEYATPECRTPQELVLHERAGEIIVRDTMERAGHMLKNPQPVMVFKRSGYAAVAMLNRKTGTYVETIKEDSVGNHENYTSINEFSRFNHSERITKLAKNRNARHFADYLALRKLIDGIGMVDTDGFSITQKPRAINFRNYGDMTRHGSKRPFYQKGDHIEVRSGEGNKSDWATEFKFGLTSLVLRLIEHKEFPRRLVLQDPGSAVATLAKDPLGHVLLTSGKKPRGIDVLKEIVDEAVELSLAYPDAPAYELKAAVDFYQFYDDLQQVSLPDHEVSALSDRIDWAARYAYLLGRGATYATISTSDLNQVRDDLKWDQLSDRDIARRHFTKFGHTALHVVVPRPPSTRARLRVQLAQELYAADNLYSVDWDEIISVDYQHHLMPNPLSATAVHTLHNSSHNPTTKNY